MMKPNEKQPENQPKSILDPRFKYIPSAQTDVQRTWMKYGWKPTERKEQTNESGT